MKTLHVLLLNVATVAVALVAYDVLRSEPAPSVISSNPASDAPPPDGDLDEVLARLDALESARPRVRRTRVADPTVLSRLAALEEELAARSNLDDALPAAPRQDPVGDGDPMQSGPNPPTPEEIRRFRELQEAVRREDAIAKRRKRLDAVLDALPVSLTGSERDGVHRAYEDFRPRADEIWGDVKERARATMEAGGQVDREQIVANTTTVLERELTDSLVGVVNAADAATIAHALISRAK